MRVMRMDTKGIEVRGARAAWAHEIERAINRVKRAHFDKWMRREWHKAGARDHWPEVRKASWASWRSKRSDGTAPDAPRRSTRPRTTQRKLWVKGHVPPEFLDWVERRWSHDDETRAILSGCCFEVWER